MTTKFRVSDYGLMLSVIMQAKVEAGDLIEQTEMFLKKQFFREKEYTGLTHEIRLDQAVKTEVSKRVIRNHTQQPTRLIITVTKREKEESDDELSS